MLHLLIHLLIIVLNDEKKASGRGQLSPLEKLYENPARYLASDTLTVGSTLAAEIRVLPWFFVPSLLIAIVLYVVRTARVLARAGNGNHQGALFILAGIALFFGLLFLIPWLILRQRPGARIDMRLDGVHFWHNDSCVKCPWSVFNVEEPLMLAKRKMILLSVAPEAVGQVYLQKGADVLGHGTEAANRIFQFVSPECVELRPVPGISPGDLAKVLFRVGRCMG